MTTTTTIIKITITIISISISIIITIIVIIIIRRKAQPLASGGGRLESGTAAFVGADVLAKCCLRTAGAELGRGSRGGIVLAAATANKPRELLVLEQRRTLSSPTVEEQSASSE
eukprot:TRINITY_DN12745_c0_g1_i1.p2 TRINITY_DN12745_c0_g1~~TRINITY_DN12745_c0_g1_i1.p2  ORF type:complete len:114 (+),score=22.02 TRINITY_DN12745_c0_g1_i1:253-594(+)